MIVAVGSYSTDYFVMADSRTTHKRTERERAMKYIGDWFNFLLHLGGHLRLCLRSLWAMSAASCSQLFSTSAMHFFAFFVSRKDSRTTIGSEGSRCFQL